MTERLRQQAHHEVREEGRRELGRLVARRRLRHLGDEVEDGVLELGAEVPQLPVDDVDVRVEGVRVAVPAGERKEGAMVFTSNSRIDWPKTKGFYLSIAKTWKTNWVVPGSLFLGL